MVIGESSSSSLSYCLWIMVYGVGSNWSSMGYAAWCLWFIFELARFLRWASEHWFMEGCPTLCPMVYLARTELKMFRRERSISEFKSLVLHTLLEWSSSFNLFPCSNFLEMLDICNLCVWCIVFHVHPQCTWTFD